MRSPQPSVLNFSWSVFPSNHMVQARPPSASPQANRAGKCMIHVIMFSNVTRVPALRAQIIDFTKYGIFDNLRNPVLSYSDVRKGPKGRILDQKASDYSPAPGRLASPLWHDDNVRFEFRESDAVYRCGPSPRYSACARLLDPL